MTVVQTLNGVTDLQKVDSAATRGLLGVEDSLAYRIHELERHLHSYERWFELAAVPNGTIHRGDAIGTGAGAFQIDAGNDVYGAWVQVLGSSDTPAIAGSTHYNVHRINVEATERAFTYVIQIGFGVTGAAALTAGTYTEVPFTPATNLIDSGPIIVQTRRQTAGTLAWARCICPGQNTATMDFYIGIHEYEG